MARLSNRAAVYNAAADWKQRCLMADGSVLSDGKLWTAEHTAELIEALRGESRYIEAGL